MHECKICDAWRLPREGLGCGAKCQGGGQEKKRRSDHGVLLDCHLLVVTTAARVQAMVVAFSVADLDAWIAKLRAEGGKFLDQPYRLGDTAP
jgi:hypothetical protein